MSATEKNYYEILGVPTDAKQDKIKEAFRYLARTQHPDVLSADKFKEANDSFRLVIEAKTVLSDPERRRQYDRTHPTNSHRTSDHRATDEHLDRDKQQARDKHLEEMQKAWRAFCERKKEQREAKAQQARKQQLEREEQRAREQQARFEAEIKEALTPQAIEKLAIDPNNAANMRMFKKLLSSGRIGAIWINTFAEANNLFNRAENNEDWRWEEFAKCLTMMENVIVANPRLLEFIPDSTIWNCAKHTDKPKAMSVFNKMLQLDPHRVFKSVHFELINELVMQPQKEANILTFNALLSKRVFITEWIETLESWNKTHNLLKPFKRRACKKFINQAKEVASKPTGRYGAQAEKHNFG